MLENLCWGQTYYEKTKKINFEKENLFVTKKSSQRDQNYAHSHVPRSLPRDVATRNIEETSTRARR